MGGANAPTLIVIPASPGSCEVWPMKWAAVRKGDNAPDPKDALYFLELTEASSTKLLVRRPVGEGLVEFIRAGTEEAEKLGNGQDKAKASPSRKRSRSSSGSSRSKSRSRSRSRSRKKDGGDRPRSGGGLLALRPSAAARGGGGSETLVMKIK